MSWIPDTKVSRFVASGRPHQLDNSFKTLAVDQPATGQK